MLKEFNGSEVRAHVLAWISAALEGREGWPAAPLVD
jgi:hypothetical protein